MADRQSLEETTNCEDEAQCAGVDVRNVKFTHGDIYKEDLGVNDDIEVAAGDAATQEEEKTYRVAELPTDYEVEEVIPPQTPDGGWGWIVVGATFVLGLIVDGVSYTFGIIMPELIDFFGSSKRKTALVGSMISGVYLIVGNYHLWLLLPF